MYEEFTSLNYEQAKEYCNGSENQKVRTIIANMFHKEFPELGLILEVGCGHGIDAKLYKPNEYIGVDISKELIFVSEVFNPDYKFKCVDAEQLPFQENSYDLVFAKSILEHLPSEEIALKIVKEMLRVAKKKVLIAWHTPPGIQITKINKVIGHFGLTVNQNNYNYENFKKIIPNIIKTNVENFELWVINVDKK